MKPLHKISPLTEASFYILISLITPLHGYGIMKQVETLSDGRLKLPPGTLYGALSTLQQHGLIRQTSSTGSRNKKEYMATELGKELIEIEINRLSEMIEHGKNALKATGREVVE